MNRATISGDWQAAIEAWTVHARASGAPETTVRTRRDHLSRMARTIGPGGPWWVDGPRLLEWFGQQPWAVETKRSHRTTFRAFYRWAVEAGHVEQSPALALPTIRPSAPNPRPAPDRVYLAALAAGDARTRLMLRLAAELGMRRAEVAVCGSWDLTEDLTGWSLLVHGKGDKERVLPMPDDLAAAVRACGPGYLFPGADNGHLSPRWVGRLVADLMPGDWTMHKLRHRAGTRWHEESGGDLLVVKELLGHASLVTVQAYVKVRNDRLRQTVNRAA